MTGGSGVGGSRVGRRRGQAAELAMGVALLGLGLAPAAALAVPLPPGGSGRPGQEDEVVARAALVRLGLGVEEAEARLTGLTPEERRQLAHAGASLAVGGAHRTTLGVVLALALLMLALAVAI